MVAGQGELVAMGAGELLGRIGEGAGLDDLAITPKATSKAKAKPKNKRDFFFMLLIIYCGLNHCPIVKRLVGTEKKVFRPRKKHLFYFSPKVLFCSFSLLSTFLGIRVMR